MVDAPMAKVRMRPFASTVATLVEDEVYVTTAFGAGFACELVAIMDVDSESSSNSVAVSWPKVMVMIGAHDTVTVSSSCNDPVWAEIVLVPAATAVTRPLLSTVATAGADEE